MTVLGGATTIAPVLMASISLDLKVSIEGAHAIFTGRMLHIRIERGTKEYRYGSCRARMDWYEYLIFYDDFSEHGLEEHSRWVESSWLADYGLYI